MTLAELQAKRNQLAAQIRAKAKEFEEGGKRWKDGEADNWKKLNDDYNACLEEIRQLRAADEVTSAINRIDQDDRATTEPPNLRGDTDPQNPRLRRQTPGGDGASAITEELRALVFQGWMRRQAGLPLKKRHVEAFKKTRAQPHVNTLRTRLLDTTGFRALQQQFRSVHPTTAVDLVNRNFRALSGNTLADGGAVVLPESLVRALEINMLAFGGMLQVAEVIRTATGEPMGWPTSDDTSNEGEQVGENADVSNSGAGGTNPTFGKVLWSAYLMSSKMILVPYSLLEDSAFDLAAAIGAMLGERLGRVINRKATVGTGAATFKGIVTAAGAGVTAASATAIAADEIIQLVHSVDPAYRAGAGFMCHDNILLHIRLLKDGNGAYLWQTGLNAGMPDRLAGYGLTVNQHMADAVATTAVTMLFGQLSKYKIRQVGQTRMKRLTERYADKDQEAFIGFTRADGNLLDAGTDPVKKLTQA